VSFPEWETIEPGNRDHPKRLRGKVPNGDKKIKKRPSRLGISPGDDLPRKVRTFFFRDPSSSRKRAHERKLELLGLPCDQAGGSRR